MILAGGRSVMFNPNRSAILGVPDLTAIGFSSTTEFQSSELFVPPASNPVMKGLLLGVDFRLDVLQLEDISIVFSFPFFEDARLTSPKKSGSSFERTGLAACVQLKMMPTFVSTPDMIQRIAL
jgi:hypothetical protein